VELDGETFDVLMEHHSDAEDRARNVGSELIGSAFMFSLLPDGAKPWLPNWLTKRFIAARRAAGLPHFRLHDLRHFMATEMLAAGIPIATVSQRLSHARASTTLNVYAHSGGSTGGAAELGVAGSDSVVRSPRGSRRSIRGRRCQSPAPE
jgi:integrase